MTIAAKPPSELTMVQVTTAVNVTRSPAFNVVPAAGTIEVNEMKSVVGEVGRLLPQPAIKKRANQRPGFRRVLLVIANLLGQGRCYTSLATDASA